MADQIANIGIPTEGYEWPALHFKQGLDDNLNFGVLGSASISQDGHYRWWLNRRWNDAPQLGWVMLNPSTADAFEDDPTIRRCMGFARAWGFGGIHVVNLYALRSTDPAGLWQHSDPIGSQNDHAIVDAVRTCPMVMLAWGSNAPEGRARDVTANVQKVAAEVFECRDWPIHALGWTKGGQPRHPLYVRADTKPVPVS